MSFILPWHTGQASASMANTFWSISAHGTRYLRPLERAGRAPDAVAEPLLDSARGDGNGAAVLGTGASPQAGGSAGERGCRRGRAENVSDASDTAGGACACASAAGGAEGTTRLRHFACGAKSPW